MLYSTVPAFQTKYPRLNSPGVTSAQLSGYLAEASEEADSYLAAGGITVPVSPAPAVLVGKVEALAYATFLQRNMHEATKETAVEAARTDALDWFKAVRDGQVSLVGSGGTSLLGGEAVRVWAPQAGYTPTFGAGPVEDFKVDTDRIDDEEAVR